MNSKQVLVSICHSYKIFNVFFRPAISSKTRIYNRKKGNVDMAVFLSKCDELLKLIPDLQCHKCKNVPGPNGNKKNRYSCIDAAHTLCEEHRNECLCGSKVVKIPSPVIANLLQNLPWMCQNYRNGCREIKMDVEDLDQHQDQCIYRQAFCPHFGCEEEGKIIFKDVVCHLEICLGEPFLEEKMSNGKANNFLVLFDSNGLFLGYWIPSKITSVCGAVFFTSGCVENETVYFWISLVGSSDEAKKYSCTYSIKSKIGNEKFIYSGPVHTLDKGYDDIIASGSLLMIGVDAAERSLNDEKKLQVEITINNLKDMEFVVSDVE